MKQLTARRLSLQDAMDLCEDLRDEDLQDWKTHGWLSPQEGMTQALKEPYGDSWGVWDGDKIIGAGGWSWLPLKAGIIWTQWTDLSLSQYKALMARLPMWSRAIAIKAGTNRRLFNTVPVHNGSRIKWLEQSGCVDFIPGTIYNQGTLHRRFMLKPLQELP